MKNKLILSIVALVLGVGSTTLAQQAAEKEVQIGVSDVFVSDNLNSKDSSFVVALGMFPNACYRWKTSEVNHIDDFTHEIKATATVNQGMCLMVLVPFSREISLGVLAPGSHLLKVLNGDGTVLEKSFRIK